MDGLSTCGDDDAAHRSWAGLAVVAAACSFLVSRDAMVLYVVVSVTSWRLPQLATSTRTIKRGAHVLVPEGACIP
jgi:hypothetical protein